MLAGDSSGLRKRKPGAKFASQKQEGEKAPTFRGHCFGCEGLVLLLCIVILTGFVGYYRSPIDTVLMYDEYATLEGKFSVNEKLVNGERIPLPGPECVVEDDKKNLYSGLSDGRIVKILPKNGIIGDGPIENITSGSLPHAVVTSNITNHGRPLGLRIKNNFLYVMDAIYGLYKINLSNKKLEILVAPNVVSPEMKFPDDLVLTKDGKTIFFTDASTTFSITEMTYLTYEGRCTGRVFRYTVESGKLEIVKDGLCFANGIQLTSDERTLIVAESFRYRMIWMDTTTWETSHILQLPSMPDNVRITDRGTYWVASSLVHNWKNTFIAKFPLLRKIAVGLLPTSVLLMPFNQLHNIAFEITEDGEIVNCWHDPHGKLTFDLTHITELSDGRYALGSYVYPYLIFLNKQ